MGSREGFGLQSPEHVISPPGPTRCRCREEYPGVEGLTNYPGFEGWDRDSWPLESGSPHPGGPDDTG